MRTNLPGVGAGPALRLSLPGVLFVCFPVSGFFPAIYEYLLTINKYLLTSMILSLTISVSMYLYLCIDIYLCFHLCLSFFLYLYLSLSLPFYFSFYFSLSLYFFLYLNLILYL